MTTDRRGICRAVLGVALIFSYGFVAPSLPNGVKDLKGVTYGPKVLHTTTVTKIEVSDGEVRSSLDARSRAHRLMSLSEDSLREFRPVTDEFSLVEAAKDYVDRNYERLGVSSKDVRVNSSSIYWGQNFQFVRFNVFRDGLLIRDAGIGFRFVDGHLRQIENRSFSEAKEADVTPRGFRPDQEIKKVFSDVSSIQQDREYYRVKEVKRGYELHRVKQYKVVAAGRPYLVELGDLDGSVYELRSQYIHVRGHADAELHQRYYADELKKVGLPFLNLDEKVGAVVTDDNGAFFAKDGFIPSVKESLYGQNVVVKTESGDPIGGELDQGTGELHLSFNKHKHFDKPWLDKELSQTMVYYHTDRVIQHAKKWINPDWFNKPLLANTNLPDTCNAHWDGETINFYSGNAHCANTGLIADVVYHEWGHGLDDHTGGIEDPAFSEGYGDIVSMLMTDSPIIGVGFMTDGTPVRRLDILKVYPQDQGGVHAEGVIIGGTFWDLYSEMKGVWGREWAREKLSEYVFKMIYAASRYTEVYSVINLFVDKEEPAVKEVLSCMVNRAFSRHGLTEKEERCRTFSIDSHSIEEVEGNENGIVEPGEKLSLNLSLKNDSGGKLSQVIGSTQSSFEDVDLERSELVWNEVGVGELASPKEPVLLTVNERAQCGDAVTLDFKLEAFPNVSFYNTSFYVGKMIGREISREGEGLPVEIPDEGQMGVDLDFIDESWDQDTEVLQAQLKVKIDHTYPGDIIVNLAGPNGKSYLVYRGQGRGELVQIEKDVSEIFKGQKIKGKWTLTVKDVSRSDEGSLVDYSLSLTPKLFKCE